MHGPSSLREAAKHVAKKVAAATALRGSQGEKHLASGERMVMRFQPPNAKAATMHEYEVLGFVIGGRAELHLDGQVILLEPNDSWVVPARARHSYRILEPFTVHRILFNEQKKFFWQYYDASTSRFSIPIHDLLSTAAVGIFLHSSRARCCARLVASCGERTCRFRNQQQRPSTQI